MGYKINNTLKKSRPVFIVILVLWIFSSIVFVPPFTVSSVEATSNGVFDFGKFVEKMLTNIGDMGGNISKAFSPDYIGMYFKMQVYLIIGLLFAAILGLIKSMPRHEYTDIEHGSSDWCEGGEQYKVLSKKKGILLAEKHYLPVDKRGNVNVMIVGRFWFW